MKEDLLNIGKKRIDHMFDEYLIRQKWQKQSKYGTTSGKKTTTV